MAENWNFSTISSESGNCRIWKTFPEFRYWYYVKTDVLADTVSIWGVIFLPYKDYLKIKKYIYILQETTFRVIKKSITIFKYCKKFIIRSTTNNKEHIMTFICIICFSLTMIQQWWKHVGDRFWVVRPRNVNVCYLNDIFCLLQSYGTDFKWINCKKHVYPRKYRYYSLYLVRNQWLNSIIVGWMTYGLLN